VHHVLAIGEDLLEEKRMVSPLFTIWPERVHSAGINPT